MSLLKALLLVGAMHALVAPHACAYIVYDADESGLDAELHAFSQYSDGA